MVEEEGGGAFVSRAAVEVGLRTEADRNMSCHGGVVELEVSLGSEYGTNSIADIGDIPN